MSEDWERRAYELLERARRLQGDARQALIYMVDNVSVGDLRAVEDLRRKGLRDPVAALDELVEMGLVERGRGCFNLAAPLRTLIARRGPGVVERALGSGPG